MCPKSAAGRSRRSFLKAVGAGSCAVGIAGCTSQDDPQDTATSTRTTTESTPAETTTGGGGGEEFSLTVTQNSVASTLDPHNHSEGTTDIALRQTYEKMLGRDFANNTVVPRLATGVERIEPGRYRFEVREGVTFHNGDPLTAEDVAFTMNRINDDEVGIASPVKDTMSGVVGAEVAEEGTVDVLSDGLNPILFQVLASNGQVLQKSWVEEREPEQIAQEANGTGPFVVEEFEQDVALTYSRNEEYWREPAFVTDLTFDGASEASTRVNKLLQGESDFVTNVPVQDLGRLRDADGVGVAAVPSARIIFIAMRYDVEPFTSREFRRAMNYAIDVQSIVENVLDGLADAVGQPTIPEAFGYNEDVDPYPYDPAKAEQLVEESGFAGAEIELQAMVGRYLKDLEVGQAVISQIDELPNVNASLQQREQSSLLGEITADTLEERPHMYFLGLINRTFDATYDILPALTCDGFITSFCNEEADELIAQAQSEGDTEKREQLLEEANRVYHDEAPWIYLHRQYSLYGISDRIRWDPPRPDERLHVYDLERGS